MIYQVLHILFSILYVYLAINTLYILFLAIAGHLNTRTAKFATSHKRFAVLITTYKEDEVIIRTVSSAVEHNYPASMFDVYVAADQLKPSTLQKLSTYRARIYEVSFDVSSKAKSLNFLLNTIDSSRYDYALILDGDNIMMDGFLTTVNNALDSNSVAIQAHRTAKNINTPIATLDALSEEVNNHIFRKAPSTLGFSSSLIGSGMAFPFNVLKQIYNKPGIVDNPACDREVDFEMLVHGMKIRYVDNAILLDEKVAGKVVYRNQRRRWIESQIMHISLFFSDWKRVARKTADFWHKLFIQLMPPRMLMLATFILTIVLLSIGLVINLQLSSIPFYKWVILFCTYLFAIIISIPARLINLNTFSAFLHLPVLLLNFLGAVFTARRRRKEFVHTPKSYTGDSASTDHRQ